MKPTFLTLGDQTVNVAHVLIVREVARAAAPIGRDVSIDMGKMGTVPWVWTPRDEGELGWFYRAIGRRRPGEEPEAKSEDRNPKAEGNPKAEIRNAAIESALAHAPAPQEPIATLQPLPVRARRK